MELEDDEEVGDEELISHKAATTQANIMVQPKSQLQLHGQVASQQSTHTTIDVQPIVKRSTRQKSAQTMLTHYACVVTFDDEPTTLT